MVREVRSPWSSTGNEPRRGESPGAYSNPSNGRTRSDGGHAVRSPGKGPAVRRPDNSPVLGGYRSPLDPRDPTPRSDRC